jgi:hypothetical protein
MFDAKHDDHRLIKVLKLRSLQSENSLHDVQHDYYCVKVDAESEFKTVAIFTINKLPAAKRV